MDKTRFDLLDLRAIAASTTNPRKHFDQAKLAELAESIRASGVHQPILVRPLPGVRVPDTEREVQFEIVSGERRFRASQLAGADTIPAICRDLSDDQVLEVQLVENLQRSDLSELEEAEGYEQLMQHSGLTADQVGEKIGKSRSYVYGRLKLLDLSQEARQALGEGRLDASRALLIARIPDQKLQIKAVEFATQERYGGAVPSVREFQSWLQDNVMLRLDRAVFDVKAEGLAAGIPSCMACPKRTGANPDLFSDVQSADVCTDPKCFESKKEAHYEAVARTAAERGQKVIAGKEALEILPSEYSRPEGYRRLDEKDYVGGMTTTLRKMIGKENLPTPVLLLNPHTKQLEEVIPTATATKLLAKVNGKKSKTGSKEAKEATVRLELDYRERWRAEAVHRVFGAVLAGKLQVMSVAFARLIAEQLAEMTFLGRDELELVSGLLGTGNVAARDGVRDFIRSCPDEMVAPALLLMMVMADLSEGSTDISERGLQLLAHETGIELDPIKAQVRAEMFPEPEPVQTPDTAPQADPPLASAAPASKGGRKPRGKPAQPSVDEAQLAIAAAMQAADASSPIPFTVGQAVRFKQDLKTPGGKLRKVSGREGTIEQPVGGRAFSVRFGEKSHETAIADYTELEAAHG